jgi:Sec-independent protein translocase protein TatA
VLIGSAAAVAIALPAKSMIQKNYKVVTGRDVGADINEAKSDIQNLSSEVKQSFKQGRQKEDRRTPKKNNQVEYDQHGIQIEGQVQYDQQRKITNQIQYDQCNQQEHQMGEDLPQYQPFQPGQFEKEEETGQYDQQEIQYSQQGQYYQPENDGWNKK